MRYSLGVAGDTDRPMTTRKQLIGTTISRKRRRKNMNLSLETFRRLDRMRLKRGRDFKMTLSWDNFFSRILIDLEAKSRRAVAR